MSLLRPTCLILAVLCAAHVTAPAAHAQSPYYGYPYWWNSYYGFGRLYHHANARVLPYFALYPPVYYSHSVPRPYGFSPFALPPGVAPAEGVVPPKEKTKEIVNPYYHPDAGRKKPADATAKTARLIVNPYFQSPDLASRPTPSSQTAGWKADPPSSGRSPLAKR